MKTKNFLLLTWILSSVAFTSVEAQDDGFIYGKVKTVDGTTYEGPIRWGKEEIFWSDHFNASKYENENLRYLSRDERDQLDIRKNQRWVTSNNNWIDRRFMTSTWTWDSSDKHLHQFICEFGDLAMIRPSGRSSVMVTMRNGEKFELDGSGYNDIGTKIKVIDPELGSIDLIWDRVEFVEFMNAPKKIINKFGEPLFGTVETSLGKFTGFIQWDHDERISTDKLDGNTDDGKISIEFGNIKSIKRLGSNRSEVILNSGRKLVMSGSNDVNSENRGVIVNIEGVGRVDIPWSEFDQVTFEKVSGSGQNYQQYKKPDALTATVRKKSGESVKGKLVFDLDESYDFEILHGEMDDIKFLIPFKYIKSISPKNYTYSEVVLKNGAKYVLGNSQDVSDKNSGLLVFESKSPTYIVWEDVAEIIF